jgi:hypothetical protein
VKKKEGHGIYTIYFCGYNYLRTTRDDLPDVEMIMSGVDIKRDCGLHTAGGSSRGGKEDWTWNICSSGAILIFQTTGDDLVDIEMNHGCP